MRQYVIDRYHVEFNVVDERRPLPETLSKVVDLTASNWRARAAGLPDLPGLIAVAAGTDVDHVVLVSARRLGPDPDALAVTFGVPVDDLREEYAEGRLSNDDLPNDEGFADWLANVYGPRWLAADPNPNAPDAAAAKVEMIPAPAVIKAHTGADFVGIDEAHYYHYKNVSFTDYADKLAARGPVTLPPSAAMREYTEQLAGRVLRAAARKGQIEDLAVSTVSYADLGAAAKGETDPAAADAPRIIPVLDLSTAHLPADLRDDLNGEDGVIADKRREYGWFMWVPDYIDDQVEAYGTIPAVIVDIWRYARAHGCEYVLFDTDAGKVDGLRVFGEYETEEDNNEDEEEDVPADLTTPAVREPQPLIQRAIQMTAAAQPGATALHIEPIPDREFGYMLHDVDLADGMYLSDTDPAALAALHDALHPVLSPIVVAIATADNTVVVRPSGGVAIKIPAVAASTGITVIDYMYRDAHNYKAGRSHVLAGIITDEDRDAILAHTIGENRLFYPVQVGMANPANDLPGSYDDDPPYSELVDITTFPGRVAVEGTEHVSAFVARFLATTWQTGDEAAAAASEAAAFVAEFLGTTSQPGNAAG